MNPVWIAALIALSLPVLVTLTMLHRWRNGYSDRHVIALGVDGVLGSVALATLLAAAIGQDTPVETSQRWGVAAAAVLVSAIAAGVFVASQPPTREPVSVDPTERRIAADGLIAAANARLSHFENDLGALLTAPLLADPGYIRRKTIAQYASLVADGPTILAGQEWDEALADYEDNARALVGHVDKAIAEALDVGLALNSDGKARLIRAAAALVPVAEDPHRTPLERASARQTIVRLLDGVIPVPSAWLASVERLDVIEPVQDAPPWEKPLRS